MIAALSSLLAALGGIGSAATDSKPLERQPPLQGAVASWYDDGYGPTASGRRYRYGFASLIFSSEWGVRVEFHHAGRIVIGQLDDHGPYVSGRTFDLNASLRGALACPDLCQLQWRLAR
jgi:rare lipoprotein A (peptidoglycan hydrolase)